MALTLALLGATASSASATDRASPSKAPSTDRTLVRKALPNTTATARWLPNPANATWTYAWRDDTFLRTVVRERYTVAKRTDRTVDLQWTTQDAGNGPDAPPSQGTMSYVYSDSGLVNTNWTSTAPPPAFPVLCASATQCGNSLASAHYQLIWGSRAPVLQEPLVAGGSWSSTGGQGGDVASRSRYAGRERVVVPAFPRGVYAAKVVTEIAQAGAIGDPYGSGTRTTWWAFGVGPVRISLAHAGGQSTSAELQSTNLTPRSAPSDSGYFPLVEGDVMRFSYRNSRHLRTPSRQRFTVARVANNSARVDVRDTRGPIRVAGSYVFASGLSGVVNTTTATSARTRVRFPPLGPRRLPTKSRRRFFTPMDLLTYGYNPVVPAYPAKGQTWRSKRGGRDRQIYGVTGSTKVVGRARVKVPAGTYRALHLRSTLRQSGFRYGSGTRDVYLAPGVGLVKLRFRHGDGSVSTVERLR
ncbi:MAG: hypothetical protein M0P31_07210 [Solirubrobacteraceae bacterium]|nr:hypothetical protein [Solirubrobacteraceae bacterium]